MTPAEKYRKVLEIRKKKTYKAEDECGFGRNTLANAIKENREMSEEYHNKFMTHYEVNPDWWNSGKGEILIKNGTYVEIPKHNNGNAMTARETFYTDLIEGNEEYSILPRAVLKDYKIVPDKIIDVIIQSTDEARKALEKAKDLEIDSLVAKHETIIKGLNIEIEKLKNDNDDLRRQIPGQG